MKKKSKTKRGDADATSDLFTGFATKPPRTSEKVDDGITFGESVNGDSTDFVFNVDPIPDGKTSYGAYGIPETRQLVRLVTPGKHDDHRDTVDNASSSGDELDELFRRIMDERQQAEPENLRDAQPAPPAVNVREVIVTTRPAFGREDEVLYGQRREEHVDPVTGAVVQTIHRTVAITDDRILTGTDLAAARCAFIRWHDKHQISGLVAADDVRRCAWCQKSLCPRHSRPWPPPMFGESRFWCRRHWWVAFGLSCSRVGWKTAKALASVAWRVSFLVLGAMFVLIGALFLDSNIAREWAEKRRRDEQLRQQMRMQTELENQRRRQVEQYQQYQHIGGRDINRWR